MAVITPQTNIRLIKLPIEIDNSNQLTFNNANDQYNYFHGIQNHIDLNNATYVRKDNTIRFNLPFDDIITYNYVMYQNESYSDKWFYAYITDIRYLSNESSAIEIKTDVYQTWMFNMNFNYSFIEREHVNNDNFGLHTIPEDLETGDYISCKLQPTKSTTLETCFCMAVTELVNISGYATLNEILPTAFYYIGLTTLQGIDDMVKAYDTAGKADAINSIFVIPKEFFSSWTTVTGINGQISKTVRFSINKSYNVTRVNYLANEYYPRNNKLLCYPYSYLQVSNHNGTIVNYNWENFNLLDLGDTSVINFQLYGYLVPSGSFVLCPVNYNNILNNFDDNVPMGKYPIGGWNSDTYTNWLTQNGINVAGIQINASQLNYAKAGIQTAVGATMLATGNIEGAGFIGSGIGGIFSAMQSNYQHSLIPDQARGNVNVGDYTYARDLIAFTFKRMSIKEEYARVIDLYFDRFGYKVNTVKLPNLTGRLNWNYVKTIGANIFGDIPRADLDELKIMFDSGITLWHNANTFLDYSQNNYII